VMSGCRWQLCPARGGDKQKKKKRMRWFNGQNCGPYGWSRCQGLLVAKGSEDDRAVATSKDKERGTLIASIAYSTWKSRPSGEKVLTPRSYSERVRNMEGVVLEMQVGVERARWTGMQDEWGS
jgi:hypothetical protein